MKGQKGGMLWVDRGGDRRSKTILTQNFPGEERPQDKNGKERGWAFYGARDLSIKKGGGAFRKRCPEHEARRG